VAESVVDVLEPVEVEHEDCQLFVVPSGHVEGVLDPIVKEHAVRQTGEPVVQGLMAELLLGLVAGLLGSLLLGDVPYQQAESSAYQLGHKEGIIGVIGILDPPVPSPFGISSTFRSDNRFLYCFNRKNKFPDGLLMMSEFMLLLVVQLVLVVQLAVARFEFCCSVQLPVFCQ